MDNSLGGGIKYIKHSDPSAGLQYKDFERVLGLEKAKEVFNSLQTYADISGSADTEAERTNYLNRLLGYDDSVSLYDKWLQFVNGSVVSSAGLKSPYWTRPAGGVLRRHVEGIASTHTAKFDFDADQFTPIEFTAVWMPTYQMIDRLWTSHQRKLGDTGIPSLRQTFLINEFIKWIKEDIVRSHWQGDEDASSYPTALMDSYPTIAYDVANTGIESYNAAADTTWTEFFQNFRMYDNEDNDFQKMRQMGTNFVILAAESEKEQYIQGLTGRNNSRSTEMQVNFNGSDVTVDGVPIRGNAIISPLFYPENKPILTTRQNLGYWMTKKTLTTIEFDRDILKKHFILVATVKYCIDFVYHPLVVKASGLNL